MKVVIVGAGLTGAYTAYLLAKAGVQVISIDPLDTPGRASEINPGGLNPLHGPGIPGPVSAFALRCHQLHKREWTSIQSLSPIDFQPRLVTRLMVAVSKDELDALSSTADLYQDTPGFGATQLNADNLRELRQGIGPAAEGGVLTHGNASVNSALYTNALLLAAQKMGAGLVKARVDSVACRGGKITTIGAGSNYYSADNIVFCTGPRVIDMEKWLGETIPVKPVKGELLLAQLDEQVYQHDVTWRQFGFYRAGHNRFWLGGTREDCGLDGEITERAATSILEGIQTLMPSISETAIVDQQFGLRPMSPDGLPLLGKLKGWDNGYVANGAGVKGVLFSAGLAQAIAGLLTAGKESEEMKLFSPYRFTQSAKAQHA